MFEEIVGLPAHPLLIHAAVVFVPLLAVLAVAYAFVPFVRPHTRWVLGLLAVAAPGSALLAKLSGDAFFDRLDARDRISDAYYPRLEEHQELGTYTMYAAIVLGVLTLALVFLVAPRGAAGASSKRIVSLLLGVLVLLAGAASVYYVVRTGDTGAKAVWEGS